MFSDELQMLIDAAVADGEITEKERALLHKRAIAEGVDTDELDMIIDARIQKQNPQAVSAPAPAETSESALQKLLKTIKEIENAEYQGSEDMIEDKKNDDIIEAISNMYLPKDRDELLELAVFMKAYSEKDTSLMGSLDGYQIAIVKAYREKYKELREKMRMLFPNDEQIIAVIGEKEPVKKKGFFSKLFG